MQIKYINVGFKTTNNNFVYCKSYFNGLKFNLELYVKINKTVFLKKKSGLDRTQTVHEEPDKQ